jgi:L-rhamnonate dehydratase
MQRRNFLALCGGAWLGQAGSALAAPLPFQDERSKLKITGVRLVRVRPKRPVPSYQPAAGSWSTNGVEVASPMSVYPEYKSQRSLFLPDPGGIGEFTVEIATDKGVKGYGTGGIGGGEVVTGHFVKLLLGEDPFNIERIWDILFRSSLYYGQAGVVANAISGVDLALWDLVGNALGVPVYKLLGGATKARIPTYCTGNDIEQHVQFGYKGIKLAVPYGPADGRDGLKKNVELVKRAREVIGPDGNIMLDCWMALNETYTMELADAVAPYRIYWMEECLPPYDFEGFGRLRAAIKSTRIVTGEHIYFRYGFRQLLEHEGAAIWQPDIHWCGGLTELRRIAALAAAYDIPVIPHAGGVQDCVHFTMATPNAPCSEMFMPAPGGPPEVYRRFEEDNQITRGPEGIYMRASDRPGFGWEREVVA